MEENKDKIKLDNLKIKNNQPNTNKKNKKIIVISIIAISIIIIAIIIYFNIYNNSCIRMEPHYIPSKGGQVVDKKPIIYLYPEYELELCVKLGKTENITCSYPEYNNGWKIIAKPDGTLIQSETGKELYSLYWEGIHSQKANLEEGFVVKGNETIKFLEEKLEILGLNAKEKQEFIIYWLPILQQNKYNYIRFATIEEINKNMPLEFSIKPDTLIRILMQYKPLEKYIQVKEQKLVTPQRVGFVAVEWGGTKIK